MMPWFGRMPLPVAVGRSGWGRRALVAVALLAFSVGLLGPALAQAPSPGAPAASPDEQFAQLKQRLAITPAQEAKFAGLVQVMRQNTATRDAFVARNPPSVQRDALAELRVQADAASLDARGLQRLVPAFQTLYLSLSPQQRQAADQAFAPPPQGPPGQPAPQR
jgi:periplasmic protein CpxP/Spy